MKIIVTENGKVAVNVDWVSMFVLRTLKDRDNPNGFVFSLVAKMGDNEIFLTRFRRYRKNDDILRFELAVLNGILDALAKSSPGSVSVVHVGSVIEELVDKDRDFNSLVERTDVIDGQE